MKAIPSLDLKDSLLPGPLVFYKLKSLLGDEDLKSFDLLAFIKIDPCLMLQFLNFSTLLEPKIETSPTSLEEAASILKKTDILKCLHLELLKAEGFSYSREFCTHYTGLWQEALFSAAFLELASPLLNIDADFAYTLGLLKSIDRIVDCFLAYGPTKKLRMQGSEASTTILAQLPIPEALSSILMAQKDLALSTKKPLAYALSLSNKLQRGEKVEALPPNLGFSVEALPNLYKKAEKRLQDIQRFISVF